MISKREAKVKPAAPLRHRNCVENSEGKPVTGATGYRIVVTIKFLVVIYLLL